MNTDEQVPPGWAKATIGSLVSLVNGCAFKPSDWHQEGTPIIRIQNLNNPNAPFNRTTSTVPDKYRVAEGDLLFAWSGTPGTSFGAHIWRGDDAYLNQHIFNVLYPKDYFDLVFLRDAINFNLNQYIRQAHGGAGLAHITKGKFEESEILIAPLAEQRRIVARIEELFAVLDAAVEELERVRANLKRYRASVLKAAVSGDLTADWRAAHPNAEPASVLLDRILADRRAKWEADQLAKFAADGKTPPKNWQAKYAEPSKPDTSKLPPLPAGWAWASVDQLSEIQGGIQKQPSRKPVKNTFPFLRVANVHRDRLELDDVHLIELFAGELERLRLEPGDILIVEGNGSRTEIGRSAIWNDTIKDCVHQNHIIRVRYLAGPSSYFNCYWNSPSGNGRVMEQAASTSGLYTLSVRKISELPVPLPPLAEQEAIVAEVEAALSDVTAAEAAVNANLTRAARLRQSILKEAFAGRLVPQDPADEPAAVLLERIRAAKPTAAPAKTPRGRKATAEVNEAVVDVQAFAVATATEAGALNRTKIQKFAAVLQTHHGVEIVPRFQQAPFGPYAAELEAMEPVCGERGFFTTEKQPKGEDGFEVAYVPGENAEAGRAAGVKRLGENTANAEKLLRLIRSMTTDEAELFATVYAVWNDSLLDGKPVDEAALVAGVYAWNVKKKKFTEADITSMIARLRTEGYEPTGRGKHTEPTKPNRGREKATAAE